MTPRLAFRLSVVLGLTSLLAACVDPNGAAQGPLNPRYGAPGHSSGPGEQPPPSGGPPPSTAELSSDPLRFKGMAGQEVVIALGEPNFRRREAPAEIWQYYGQGCVLDLFLYKEGAGQRVSHVDLRSRSPGQSAEASCLAPLFAGKHAQPVS